MDHNLVPVPTGTELWIVDYWNSQAYRDCIEQITRTRIRSISAPGEVAMIVGLLKHLKPEAQPSEIGTFFAGTTMFMAEAMMLNRKGRLATIDPFGAERVPAIIKGWPTELQSITHFYSQYSMEYFAKRERPSALGQSKLGLVFVDGNHKFQYALFDMTLSADHLAPGGAIVADNLEQEGPRGAVREFLRMNPAWKLFQGGTLKSVEKLADSPPWGVLLSPPNCQVGTWAIPPTEAYQPTPRYMASPSNLRDVSRSGLPEVILSILHGHRIPTSLDGPRRR